MSLRSLLEYMGIETDLLVIEGETSNPSQQPRNTGEFNPAVGVPAVEFDCS